MKRVLLLALLVVLLLSSVVVGCGGGVQPTGTSTGPTAARPTASQEVITLKWADWMPVSIPSFLGGFRDPVAKLLEEKSGGRLKINIYPSETLVKSADLHDSLVSGVIDINAEGTSQLTGRIPLLDLGTVPFLWRNSLTSSQVMTEAYDSGVFGDEVRDVKILDWYSTPPWNIGSRIPINSVADFKGTKFAASGYLWSEWGKLNGATMVSLGGSGMNYDALSKGMIDWVPNAWMGQQTFKYYEVTKYAIDGLNIVTSQNRHCMNLDTWNRLPPDLQGLFNQYFGLWATIGIAGNTDMQDMYYRELVSSYYKKVGAPGMSVFPTAELAKLKAQAQSLYDYMIGIAEKAGKPGKASFARLQELNDKYIAMYPPGSETEYKVWCKYPHSWVFPGYGAPLKDYMWAKWTAPNTYELVPTGEQSAQASLAEYERYYGTKFVSPGE